MKSYFGRAIQLARKGTPDRQAYETYLMMIELDEELEVSAQ